MVPDDDGDRASIGMLGLRPADSFDGRPVRFRLDLSRMSADC